MRKAILLPLVALLSMWSCASSSTSSGGPKAPEVIAKAPSFTAHGLSIARPEGWLFLAPDTSVSPDTVVVLQGPFGDGVMAPAVEVARRPLDARLQRRKPSHILTQLTMEIVQLFDGFEMQGAPEEIEVAGKPAAQIRLNFSESMPDGAQVDRSGRFYGIIHRDSIWLIRCLGAPDGSNDTEFDSIIRNISIEI